MDGPFSSSSTLLLIVRVTDVKFVQKRGHFDSLN